MNQITSQRGPRLLVIGCAMITFGFVPVALWAFFGLQAATPEFSKIWVIIIVCWLLCISFFGLFLKLFVQRDIQALSSNLEQLDLSKDFQGQAKHRLTVAKTRPRKLCPSDAKV